MHLMKCEAHGRNEAENLPFATNRLVKIDDFESKNQKQKSKAETFESKIESNARYNQVEPTRYVGLQKVRLVWQT